MSGEPVRSRPLIVGASRSGTTLLRLMLDAHSELAIGPETHFVPKLLKTRTTEEFFTTLVEHPRFPDQQLTTGEIAQAMPDSVLSSFDSSEAVRGFYAAYAAKRWKNRSGDKTPGYVRQMPQIQAALPEARFIHIIRDGRDVALSCLRTGMGPQTLKEQADFWRKTVRKGRTSSRELLPGSYMEVFYEDLVHHPEAVLGRVCEFVELPYEERMLYYHERAGERIAELNNDLASRSGEGRMAIHEYTQNPPDAKKIGTHEWEMSAAEVRIFEKQAGRLLEKLGYPLAT